MKSWSRLCLLVLAISPISRGQNGPTAAPHDGEGHHEGDEGSNATASQPPPSVNATENEATPSTPSPQGHASGRQTFTTSGEHDFIRTDTTGRAAATGVRVPERGREDADVPTTTTTTTATVSMATIVTSSKAEAPEGSSNSSWGYVILVLIILVIIVLCVILYLLRRASRTYSFDLQRQSPASHLNQPTGTFEPVYLDDLERPAPKDPATADDLSPPPVANGTSLQSEEKGSNGENAPLEHPDENGVETSPTSNTSPSPGDDPADDPLSSTSLFFDAIGEQQNENNNNNPSVCSSDPFVEINLEEAPWSDQLLAGPGAPSSVLPFSPFPFSSSSSSSSFSS